jgi:hypothetical protein
MIFLKKKIIIISIAEENKQESVNVEKNVKPDPNEISSVLASIDTFRANMKAAAAAAAAAAAVGKMPPKASSTSQLVEQQHHTNTSKHKSDYQSINTSYSQHSTTSLASQPPNHPPGHYQNPNAMTRHSSFNYNYYKQFKYAADPYHQYSEHSTYANGSFYDAPPGIPGTVPTYYKGVSNYYENHYEYNSSGTKKNKSTSSIISSHNSKDYE